MNNLILVRHGQSKWNLEKRFTGWTDIELTDQGIVEAKQAGKLIKDLDINISYFFTSLQKRAVHTIEIILDALKKDIKNITKVWELNEKSYGALTGLNKDEMKKIYGEKQIQIFRRAWDVSPPPMSRDDKNHPKNIDTYNDVPRNKIPDTESLKNTFERVVPFYEAKILPILNKQQNILIVAHGNSLRSLCKKILNISNEKISEFEIPTGNPLVINFDKYLKIKKCEYLDSHRSNKILINL